MTQIIDLDEVLGADKKVKLGGKVYKLPPDIPVELYLKITGASKRGVSEEDFIADLYEDVLGLFRYAQPTLKKLPIGLAQLVVAIGTIYGDQGATDQEERPTRKRASRASGGATKSPSGRTRSR